ncbi:hypothetical protein ABIC85_003034 [Oerskovia enterophila]
MANWRSRLLAGAATALLAVGLVGAGSTSASALGQNQCSAPAWNINGTFTDGTVAQSCGPKTTVRYSLGCYWQPTKTFTVYFGANGSSRVTNLPACLTHYTGYTWAVV